jgi:predicted Zn-dependent protease
MIDAQQVCEDALAASTADGCIVLVAEHSETNLRWALNEVTTNGQMRSRTVTLISTLERPDGTRAGVVTRSVTDPVEVAALVRASEEAARSAEPAEDAAPLVEPYENEDDWGGEAATTSVSVFERFAAELARALADWRARDRLLFGYAEHQLTSYFLASSTGLRRRFDQPDGRIEVNGKSADLARSAWAGEHVPDFGAVRVEPLVRELDQRLDWAATRIELPPGRYETLLPPTAVADLLLDAYWIASAKDAEEGRNAFAAPGGATRIGERLADLPLRLYSDPLAPGLTCPPFVLAQSSDSALQSVFDNGAPIAPADWLAGGVLTDLVRTRAHAARTGQPFRPMVGNLLLDGGGAATLPEMVAATERGLLLTSLWYIREVDPETLLLTGLTRDGVYLIEDGRVQGAVNNFRFNESPISLLRRITEVGRTQPTLPREMSDYFRRTAMPPVRVPDFHMSTVSPAS